MAGNFILNRNTFAPIAPIEAFEQIQWTRDFFRNGNFTMTINQNNFNAKFIEKGQLIGIVESPDKNVFDHVYMIEQIERMQSNNVAEEMLVVSGRDIGGMLEERLVIPDGGQDYDSSTGPSESLMKFFVSKHLGPSATANRQLPNLFIVTDQGRGPNFTYQARYQILMDTVEEISRNAQIGWEIVFDTGTNTFQYDVIIGNDKTIGSGDPVIFDFEWESVLEQQLLQTDFGRKTFAYVGGDGELNLRTVVTTFIQGSEPTGFERKEMFVDAQDQNTLGILTLKGNAELQKTDIDDAIEIVVNKFGPFQYRDNYDLGDIITIRNQKWNFQKDMQIVNVENTMTRDFPTTITKIVLDKPLPDFKKRIREALNKFDPARRI